MQRRVFAHAFAHALTLGLAGSLTAPARTWAAPGDTAPVDTRLLLVMLRGACDATNVLVPRGAGATFYTESRPRLALAAPGSGPDAALPFGSSNDWALHPAWKDTLWPRVQAGEIAAVPFTGLHDLSRSHFETQDRLELGLPSPGEPAASAGTSASTNGASGGGAAAGTGFLNRLAQELGLRLAGPQAVMAFTDTLPLAMQGPRPVPNLGLGSLGKGATDARQAALVQRMYAGSALGERMAEGLSTRDQVLREMAGEMQAANRGALSARGFELEARRVARLMREQVRLGFIDIGGWDTHVNQGAAKGPLADRLGELGRGLASFATEMGPLWSRTVVVVVSEFGRTFRENGNRGTDHGHGTVWWVMGGGVHGGVRGEQQLMTPKTLHQGRDWPVLNDGRGMLAGLFGRLYGLDAAALDRVLPGAVPRDLGLV